ncbi:MAG: hypothetical protein FD180_3060 [Planctomycetota bacterium]|nr:MAG: hypothetical protein FD180_3060 [Planctomycetota bacterium]
MKQVFEPGDLEPFLARLRRATEPNCVLTPEHLRAALLALLNDSAFLEKLAYAIYKRIP